MDNKNNILKAHRRTIRMNGEKVEKTFSRKADADSWYFNKKREKECLSSGLSLPKEEILLQDFSNLWLQKRKDNGQPFSSWFSDHGRLKKYILPVFGKKWLNKITTKEWENFLDNTISSHEVSPATRNRIRSLACKMYNDAIRLGYLSNNPVRVIPKLKESMEAWDYWASTEEIIDYLSAAKKESLSFYIFAVISLNLGTRIGETLALDHRDINYTHRRVQINKILEESTGKVCKRTKGHTERWLGVNDSLIKSLLEYKNKTSFKELTAPLISDSEGQRLYERQVRRIHARVCKKANVRLIRIHDLRHTYASHYIMNGGSLAELQSLLGHSSPSMTLKYAHLAPGFLEKKASVVSFATPAENNVAVLKTAHSG